MPEFPLPDAETVLKTAATYGRDLAERVASTFVVGSASVAVLAGPADMFHASFWQSVAAGGLAAAGSLVKGMIARARDVKNSASLAKGV